MSTPTVQRRTTHDATSMPLSSDAQTTRPGHESHDAQWSPAGAGSDFDSGHRNHGAHMKPAAVEPLSSSGQPVRDTQGTDAAAGSTSPQAIDGSVSIFDPPAGSSSDSGHPIHDAQTPPAPVGTNFPADHLRDDTQTRYVGGEQDRNGSDATMMGFPTPIPEASLSDPFLALAADVLDDAEKSRIANENRLRQLTRSEADSDGIERGFGLDESHPDVARLAALVDMLKQIEHQAGLNLNRLLRQHALGPWVKAQKGIGEKQAARLLAVVGDPYVNEQTGEIRTVSQLWSYCGHGDPARRKFKGMTQADLFTLGNPTAKSRLWLISCAVLKAGGGEEKATSGSTSISPTPSLAAVYYHRKRATVGREHARECVRCGPSGKPAQIGSPWSDAHRHADALRITGKTILRDLWLEAKRIHEGAEA
jgi:hypothetical protein